MLWPSFLQSKHNLPLAFSFELNWWFFSKHLWSHPTLGREIGDFSKKRKAKNAKTKKGEPQIGEIWFYLSFNCEKKKSEKKRKKSCLADPLCFTDMDDQGSSSVSWFRCMQKFRINENFPFRVNVRNGLKVRPSSFPIEHSIPNYPFWAFRINYFVWQPLRIANPTLG